MMTVEILISFIFNLINQFVYQTLWSGFWQTFGGPFFTANDIKVLNATFSTRNNLTMKFVFCFYFIYDILWVINFF